ncbi:MAG: hypothetical protein ACRDRV_19665 [Pseudonocardiaceae bacterium]
MEWFALTLGVCLISALMPVVNAELYLVALVTQQPQLPWWLVGLAAAAGQMLGKLVFYYAGRGSLRLPAQQWSIRRLSRPWSTRRLSRPRRSADPDRWRRWSAWLTRLQQTCQARPVWTAGVLLAAATVGLPPLATTAFVAGAARISPATFMVVGLVGRFVRFSTIAAAPGLLATWWF